MKRNQTKKLNLHYCFRIVDCYCCLQEGVLEGEVIISIEHNFNVAGVSINMNMVQLVDWGSPMNLILMVLTLSSMRDTFLEEVNVFS